MTLEPTIIRQATLLLIEDDDDLREVLTERLKMEGHRVIAAADGATGLLLAKQEVPDLILLDQMLPDIPGTEVARQLNGSATHRDVPIIFVSARAEEVDRVVAFEVGAQDFVRKPFSTRELLLRIRAILRRRMAETTTRRTSAGPIRIDLEAHQAWLDDRAVVLSVREFDVLALLVQNAGRMLSREEMVREVWHDDADVLDRAVDSVVMRLRNRLGRVAPLLETVRGAGYRLNAE